MAAMPTFTIGPLELATGAGCLDMLGLCLSLPVAGKLALPRFLTSNGSTTCADRLYKRMDLGMLLAVAVPVASPKHFITFLAVHISQSMECHDLQI